jgi:transcriptional regulator with XRE-family HTH domain
MAEALENRDVGAILTIYRRWAGATQSQIATMTGLPQSTISDVLNGRRQVMKLDLYEKFAGGLDIPRGRLGLAEPRPVEPAANVDWLRTRRMLNRHRSTLTDLVSRIYPPSVRLAGTGVLMPESWRLRMPVDLCSVELAWQQAPVPAVNGHHAETRPLLPPAPSNRQYTKYHRAMRDLDRPRLFENRPCYRLLGVDPVDPVDPGRSGSRGPRPGPALRLRLGDMCYFDMIDVGEALAHEVAFATVDARGEISEEHAVWEALPFRRLVSDPFDLSAYPLMLSVSTLTIRRSRAGATFLLLRRDPASVAIAGGMLSVFPTGVFQPASVRPTQSPPDFDLWRNVMREYSEEYLGNPEHDGEGDVVRPADGREGLSFDGATVERLLTGETVAPSGAACLQLAWQHRAQLLS